MEKTGAFTEQPCPACGSKEIVKLENGQHQCLNCKKIV